MKALIVNGSPSVEKGVHGLIVESLEKGLREAGSSVEKVYVYKRNIQPCQGCFSCWSHTPGECIQKDDMTSILPIVADSDILIIATPVYVDGVTGPTKTFMDRLIPLIKGRVELRNDHMRHSLRENVKQGKLVLMSASGFSEMNNFDPLIVHLKAASKNLGMEYAGEILIPSGWYLKRSQDTWEKVSQIIYSAGINLDKNGKIPSDTSNSINSLVSRDNVIDALNSYYEKIE